MLGNLKRIKWKFSILFLFFYTYGYAQDITLKQINTYNVPDTYKSIFKNFFLENLNFTDKKSQLEATIEIRWLALNYITCIFLTKNQIYFLETNCFTSTSGENYIDTLQESIKNSRYIKLKKNIKKVKRNLKLIVKGKIKDKKAVLISQQGDRLTDYKHVYLYKKQKGKFITIGGAVISQDIIVLNENSSAFLLQKFLNGYKIDKVYLIK